MLETKLKNQTYSEVASVTRTIADDIKTRLKDLGLQRYKYMVNVVIGAQKGQGVRVGSKCNPYFTLLDRSPRESERFA